MERIDFPDGGWIELRAPAEVSERLRRPHLAAVAVMMGTDANTEARVNAVRRAVETAAVALLNGWSRPEPITVDSLMDLPSLLYDQIMQVIEARQDGLQWSLVANGETITDPKADTDGSSSSRPGLPAPTVPA